jgi:ABC-type nitrate/sulfonate/bicarbonate transport system substrate-binding protein
LEVVTGAALKEEMFFYNKGVKMKIKSKLLGVLLGSVIGLGFTAQSQAQANLTEIKVSYQPALYWALPFYVATEKNWWAELGLKPTSVSYTHLTLPTT